MECFCILHTLSQVGISHGKFRLFYTQESKLQLSRCPGQEFTSSLLWLLTKKTGLGMIKTALVTVHPWRWLFYDTWHSVSPASLRLHLFQVLFIWSDELVKTGDVIVATRFSLCFVEVSWCWRLCFLNEVFPRMKLLRLSAFSGCCRQTLQYIFLSIPSYFSQGNSSNHESTKSRRRLAS